MPYTSMVYPLVIAYLFYAYRRMAKIVEGTENNYFEDMQVFFTTSKKSFIYAKSTQNQRIESFWSRLKKYKLNWWINFLSI